MDAGLVSREIYVNEDIYKQELEQVFARAWLFVGHESQVPEPGDFVISRMGEEEVILVRDRKRELHVFLNTCRHRGMKVCRYDDGNTLVFTCPFHGWSYDTDGRLVGVPYYDAAYKGDMEKKMGLARSSPDEQLLRLDLGYLGPQGPIVRGLSRSLRAVGAAVFPELGRNGQWC